MNEYTERHHAFISATFYQLLDEQFGKRGENAFILATQRYAEQRGSRMAQRAIRDGMPLTFATYKQYGEWVNTRIAVENGENHKNEVITYSPDYEERVWQCPWAVQFKAMGMEKAGTIYCTHLDKAIARGFNPYLTFDVPQSMNNNDCCIQIMRDANFSEGQTFSKKKEYLEGFDYHCGHCYKTYSEIITVIFGVDGFNISNTVLTRFAEEYGTCMADGLLAFRNTDFNLI